MIDLGWVIYMFLFLVGIWKSWLEWEMYLVESKIVCRGWNIEFECISIINLIFELISF